MYMLYTSCCILTLNNTEKVLPGREQLSFNSSGLYFLPLTVGLLDLS